MPELTGADRHGLGSPCCKPHLAPRRSDLPDVSDSRDDPYRAVTVAHLPMEASMAQASRVWAETC